MRSVGTMGSKAMRNVGAGVVIVLLAVLGWPGVAAYHDWDATPTGIQASRFRLEEQAPEVTNPISVPVSFTRNLGQVRNPEVVFYMATKGLQAGFAPSKVILNLIDTRSGTTGVVVEVTFEGSHLVEPIGRHLLPHRSNYLLGKDPSQWRTEVPNYQEVVFPELYERIDLHFRIESNQMKYEFVVSPGADPSTIHARYEGVTGLHLAEGSLVIRTVAGDLKDSVPKVYQPGGLLGRCEFVRLGIRSSGFRCDPWDRTRPLIIDPIVYSSYLGGSGSEVGNGIVVDTKGYAYVTGSTTSPDFPTTAGAYDTSKGNPGVISFVTKVGKKGEGGLGGLVLHPVSS